MTTALLVQPAYMSVPSYHRTLGPEVADLARLANFAPDPEQELVLDGMFAMDKHDRSVAFEVCIICSRQNLKTGVLKQGGLGDLFLMDRRLVVFSAHQFSTVQEAFRDFDELITGSDYLRKRVKNIYRGNGDESIELLSGARMVFKTRTKGGGRGLSGEVVNLDEGFALQAMHMGALLPTLSAQPDPQVRYGSSAGLADSVVLRALRDRGRAGKDKRLAYYEWCAPDPAVICEVGAKCEHSLVTPGCGFDEPENWRKANPQLGRRIRTDYIAAERRALPPEEFGRERLGLWDKPLEGVASISYGDWTNCGDPKSIVLDPLVVGIDVRPDLAGASIAVSGRRADGLNHGELAKKVGNGELVDRLVAMFSGTENDLIKLVIDRSSPAAGYIQALTERGFSIEKIPRPGEWPIQLIGAGEYAQACVGLASDIRDGKWRHFDQEPLNAAVRGARQTALADAWKWSRRDSTVDISPLIAVTLARYGFAAHAAIPAKPAPFFLRGN